MALTDVGLNYVSQGAAQFIRDAENATNAVTRLNGNLGELQKEQKPLLTSTNDTSDAFKNNDKILGTVSATITKAAKGYKLLSDVIEPLPDPVIKSTNVLEAFGKIFIKDPVVREKYLNFVFNLVKTFAKIPTPVLAAAAAMTAFKVGSFVLEKLGERAMGLTAIAASFENLRTSAGLSTDWLDNFTKSADNQLTKAQLLTLSNKALAGSFGEFQANLADSLPLLLEFARVRSAATGEDSAWLFESLIQGIKKGQPLILDNLGLVVKLEETYKNYAASLGVSVEALTGEQKQQAILTKVRSEAIRNINILGEATLSNADKMKARGNIYGDILDSLSLSIQPLLSLFLDIEIFFARLIGETLAPFINIITSIISILGDGFSMFFEQLQPIFIFIAELIQAVVAPFDALFRVLARLLPVVYQLWGYLTPMGIAIKIIGATLNFLTPILEGVTFLFQMIADLLVGVIDFLSFLGNTIMGVITNALSPFTNSLINLGFNLEYIKLVITQLATILAVGFGKAVAAMVNVFAGGAKNILKIVADLAQGIADFLIGQSPPPKGPLSDIDTGGKAVFESWLEGFTSLSLAPVEKVAASVNASLGDIGKLSLPQVEKRIAGLDKALRPFEEQLSIVQSRFEAIQKPAEAALSAIDRQLDMAVEALTKGDETALSSVRALDAQRAAIMKNLELQQQQVDFAQIQLALKQSQQAEERALLEIQKKRLEGKVITPKELEFEKKALEKQASPEKPKTGSGAGTPTGGDSPLGGNNQSKTGSPMGDLMLEGFASEIDLGIFDEIGAEQERLGVESGRIGEGLAGLPNRFTNAFSSVFGGNGTIANFINKIFGPQGFFVTKISELVGEDGLIHTTFNTYFGEEGVFRTMFTSLFGEEGFLATQLTFATGLFTAFETAVSGVINNITGFLTGEISFQTAMNNIFGEDGIVKTLLADGEALFTDMYNAVFGEEGIFAGVGARMEALISAPIVVLLEGLENLINSFISLAETFLNGIIDNIEDLVEYIPTELRGSLGDIIGYELVIPRVSFTPPAIQGAATGGIFTGGMMKVGEKGEEYITPANKIGVFPNNFVTALQSLESVLMQSMSIPSASNMNSNSYNYNSSSNQTININQPQNPSSIRQQVNMLR